MRSLFTVYLLLLGSFPAETRGAEPAVVDLLRTTASDTTLDKKHLNLISEASRRATAAERLWRKNRRGESFREAKRAIDLDPDSVPALYWAGRYEAWQMERFLEGERVDRGHLLSLREFGEEARDAGVGYLTRALAVDPEHLPSRVLLGSVYYEARMPEQLVGLFRDYVKQHPEDPNGHFFVGLGYQIQDDLNRAYRAYVKGLAQLSETERQFMMSIFMLTDEKALERTGGVLPDEEAIQRFWTGRDPLFLTPVNERLLEHCNRVAYANLRFGDVLEGIEGWTTDRGQAYIRYGRPLSLSAQPAEVNVGLDRPIGRQNDLARRSVSGRSYFKYTPRKEIWTYDGFSLIFDNTDNRGIWRFRIARIGQSLLGFKELVARVPEYYKDPYAWERYDVPYQIAQFRADQGKTRVEVYYALQGEQVGHQEAGPGLQEVDVQQGLFLFDAAWDTVRKEVGRVRRMPWVVYDADGEGYLFAGEQLMLDPGAYHLGVEVEDQATKAVGTFRDSLRVRRFGYDSLEASSLLLARRIVERQDRPFGREQFMILPDPLMQCAQGGQVSCYFEVYNLTQDTFGATHYRVAYQMRVLVEGRTGEVEPEWTTVVSHTLRGSRAWEPIRVTLDMEDSAPGLRALRVVVDDLADLEQAVATTTFRVMW